MMKTIKVAILGGSGYGAGELLRLLTQHPHVEVVSVVTSSQAGQRVDAVHPHLRGFYDLVMTERIEFDRLLGGEHAVVFSALPNGSSGTTIEAVMRQVSPGAPEVRDPAGRHGLRVIDLSGDFRLTRREAHETHYAETPWMAELRSRFVYGFPELNRDRVRGATCIANPGCLASASILAAAPLVSGGFRGTVVVDAKTGSSGSGRQLKETTHHPTRHADFRAYKPLAHQHEPEILQAWGDAAGERIALSFVAQSMDVTRGIFVTAHVTLDEAAAAALAPAGLSAPTVESLAQRYRMFYAGSPFVRVIEGSPTLQDVVGSNFCDLGVAVRGRQVIAMAALDNLVKGMAGTAIQNMNLMCGLEETAGLWRPSVRPV
ncbi:MAG: N-acetyl-gamma-glutamyl-phosphate reductase [Planctomycetota bacterium]|nr:MAG: N-acetyl-gamma-glutamyl-phosphate reductase [Planctomycetota bacterium]